MKVIDTIAELRRELDSHRAAGSTVGFVPTMGYLHDGHASLVRSAAEDNEVVLVSIFVNPLQFAEGEDLDDYPRDLERDRALVVEAGATHLLCPSVEEMYPRPMATFVEVEGVSAGFESMTRPTHFRGVSTVVTKLFAMVGPCRAYFGEKDFQQLAIVTRLAADLSLPVDVVGCPTRREVDGLAMSSRNVYLDPEQRAQAPVLRRALEAGAAHVEAGATSAEAVVETMTRVVAEASLAELDYAACVMADDLTEPEGRPVGGLRLLIAARFGNTRLIDNIAAG